MFNPRSSMYDDDGYPSGGLLRAYKNFRTWAEVQQRSLNTVVPRGVHWFKHSWCPHCFVWRASTVCGILGMVLTLGLLISGGIVEPQQAMAKSHENVSDRLVAAGSLTPEEPLVPILETPRYQPTPSIGTPSPVPPPPTRLEATFVPTSDWESLRWPDRLAISSLSELRSALPPGEVQFPHSAMLDAWKSALGRPFRRNTVSPDIVAVTPYASRFDVLLTSAQLADSVRSQNVAPMMATSQAAKPARFEITNRWPERVKLGKAALCELIVRNTSGHHVDQVRIRQSIQPFERVTGTSPAAGVVDGELIWDESDWPAGEQRVYTMTVVSDGRRVQGLTSVEILNSLAVSSTVVSAPRREQHDLLPLDEMPLAPAAAPNPVRQTWPQKPLVETLPSNELEVLPADPFPVNPPQPAIAKRTTLRLEMILPRAEVGEIATIQFRITNVGKAASKNTRLFVTLPDSLRHRRGKELILSIGQLAPGKSYQTNLYADVVRAGRLDVVASTDAENAEREEAAGTMSFARPVSVKSNRKWKDKPLASVNWR